MTANAGAFGKMAFPLIRGQLAYSPRQNDGLLLVQHRFSQMKQTGCAPASLSSSKLPALKK